MSETPEHYREPIRGLPDFLPDGEKILWQGVPSWQQLAIRALHVRKVALYFAALLLLRIVEQQSLTGHTQFVLLAIAGLGLLLLLAKLLARSALYTVTNRRVVMRFGIAMPISINLPFARIQTLELRQNSGSCADIAIGLLPNNEQRLSYAVMWPHARPWRLGNVEPMLRCIANGEQVAEVIRSALLRYIDAEDVQHAVTTTASGTDAPRGRSAGARPQQPSFPRAPLYGAAALLAFAIVSVTVVRLTGAPPAPAPLESALESVQLKFEDRPGGVVTVLDADTGEILGELASGTNNFLRATLRGLVRGRDAMSDDSRSAFGLYYLDDGRLLLVDDVSGRHIDLWAFGATNAEAFARFLPSHTTPLPQIASTSLGPNEQQVNK